MRAVGTKRPRGLIAAGEEQPTVPWTGRVPKPAMDRDSWVDYGSGFLRKSCDSCVSSKRRCDGQDPCTRCLRRKKPCHYTERKKCGPRSGQKAAKGGVRSSAAGPPVARSTARTTHIAAPAMAPAPGITLDQRRQGPSRVGLAPPAPPHASPALSAGELSGETTCVEYTDCSDGPPPRQMLLRNESGSSWWSLEDQQATPTACAINASWTLDQAADVRTKAVSSLPKTDNERIAELSSRRVNTKDTQQQQQEEHRGQPSIIGNGSTVGSSGGSAAGGTSAASGGDSSEEDGSEESLSQAEEEVAALLVHLGKSARFFEGFSGRDLMTNTVVPPIAPGSNTGQLMCSRKPQQYGSVGGVMDDVRITR